MGITALTVDCGCESLHQNFTAALKI